MYIHSIILRDVHNFDKLDITLYDDLWQKPLNSVLLLGVNGSGKTTLLRIIATLWDSLQWWLKIKEYGVTGRYTSKYRLNEISLQDGLMAMEIRDFPTPHISNNNPESDSIAPFPESIWVFMTTDKAYLEILPLSQSPNSGFMGVIGTIEQFQMHTSLHETWIQHLNTHLKSLQIGMTTVPQLPNMLFFDTDDRTILVPPDQERFEAQAESLYKWFTGYSNRDRNSAHIETILQNIMLRNPADFEALAQSVNQFFGSTKQIHGFNSKSRLVIQVNKPKLAHHYIENLSSGEQQCLIMMVMIWRWLMPGGIVLIDEPDLYLHVSLQRHFIRQIEKIVHARGGQLIVTSHSEYIWDNFYESNQVRLGAGEMIHE